MCEQVHVNFQSQLLRQKCKPKNFPVCLLSLPLILSSTLHNLNSISSNLQIFNQPVNKFITIADRLLTRNHSKINNRPHCYRSPKKFKNLGMPKWSHS